MIAGVAAERSLKLPSIHGSLISGNKGRGIHVGKGSVAQIFTTT
jgi:hypothetical protein